MLKVAKFMLVVLLTTFTLVYTHDHFSTIASIWHETIGAAITYLVKADPWIFIALENFGYVLFFLLVIMLLLKPVSPRLVGRSGRGLFRIPLLAGKTSGENPLFALVRIIARAIDELHRFLVDAYDVSRVVKVALLFIPASALALAQILHVIAAYLKSYSGIHAKITVLWLLVTGLVFYLRCTIVGDILLLWPQSGNPNPTTFSAKTAKFLGEAGEKLRRFLLVYATIIQAIGLFNTFVPTWGPNESLYWVAILELTGVCLLGALAKNEFNYKAWWAVQLLLLCATTWSMFYQQHVDTIDLTNMHLTTWYFVGISALVLTVILIFVRLFGRNQGSSKSHGEHGVSATTSSSGGGGHHHGHGFPWRKTIVVGVVLFVWYFHDPGRRTRFFGELHRHGFAINDPFSEKAYASTNTVSAAPVQNLQPVTNTDEINAQIRSEHQEFVTPTPSTTARESSGCKLHHLKWQEIWVTPGQHPIKLDKISLGQSYELCPQGEANEDFISMIVPSNIDDQDEEAIKKSEITLPINPFGATLIHSWNLPGENSTEGTLYTKRIGHGTKNPVLMLYWIGSDPNQSL